MTTEKQTQTITHDWVQYWFDPIEQAHRLSVKITTEDLINHFEPAEPNLSHLVDASQFFGMIEDAFCMKFGFQRRKDDKAA